MLPVLQWPKVGMNLENINLDVFNNAENCYQTHNILYSSTSLSSKILLKLKK